MNDPLRILVTNDDGIDAPGLKILEKIAGEISSDVWVVAPAKNQSGVGHKFSLGKELSLAQHGNRRYSIEGTPADCVAIGMSHVLSEKPADLVLSGVNRGQNIADIIHCSGTAAGAREGVLQGAIGIALSQSMDFSNEHIIDWECAQRYGASLVKSIVANKSEHDVFFNVNFPRCTPEEVSGIEVVPYQRFAKAAFEYYPSDNQGKFFVTILGTPTPLDSEADCVSLLERNAITVTPVKMQQSDYSAIDALSGNLSLTS